MTPSAKYLRRNVPAAPLAGRLLLAGLLWLISLLVLGLVNLAGAASYDTLPHWLLLLEVSWALAQVGSLLRLIYCL